ncbi:MAG: hypothetical protein SPH17_00495 [Faecalicoccus sp.]|uniref:hypothetical protein n=1 Tax=Faecalicoccus sp. TaxID=1971758 RepID=UPI002A90C615|nr:hypothetical protein [Faecalicoccus sp.]MDY5232074.1 hypothetical protein [Faecalicoccus sp.]
MIIRNTQHLRDILDKWENEYRSLLEIQKQYADDPSKFGPEKVVLYQMQFIDSLRLDLRDVVLEYINMMQQTPPKQEKKLDQVIQEAEEYIKSKEREENEEKTSE